LRDLKRRFTGGFKGLQNTGRGLNRAWAVRVWADFISIFFVLISFFFLDGERKAY
jgi:hypothetical protein